MDDTKKSSGFDFTEHIRKLREQIDDSYNRIVTVPPVYINNSIPKAAGKSHHIKSGLAMSKDDDQDYTDNEFSKISWSGIDYWSPFAPYMTWNNEPPKAVSVIKCDCGTSVAMGKDDQLDFHSSWCSLKGNKK